MDTVLFDLDGTLLPMEQNAFVRRYMELLAQKVTAHGWEPKPLLAALWHGTDEMIKNDGSASNSQRFWQRFAAELGEKIFEMEPVFADFYAQEFNAARDATAPNPLSRAVVDLLLNKGYTLALATNPLFPPVAIDTRLAWVDLSRADFSYISDYENSSYCKPHPEYFCAIARLLGKQPQDCLMVGNSVSEDLGALAAGMQAYLVTDCLEGSGDYSQVAQGTFRDFTEYARRLPGLKA